MPLSGQAFATRFLKFYQTLKELKQLLYPSRVHFCQLFSAVQTVRTFVQFLRLLSVASLQYQISETLFKSISKQQKSVIPMKMGN